VLSVPLPGSGTVTRATVCDWSVAIPIVPYPWLLVARAVCRPLIAWRSAGLLVFVLIAITAGFDWPGNAAWTRSSASIVGVLRGSDWFPDCAVCMCSAGIAITSSNAAVAPAQSVGRRSTTHAFTTAAIATGGAGCRALGDGVGDAGTLVVTRERVRTELGGSFAAPPG
jgi:hypothetical protein